MSIAVIAPTRDSTKWIKKFRELDPALEIQVYPEITSPEKVTCAVVWLHPHGSLQAFPNLKLICSMGAGVDHILADPRLPDVPVTRVVSKRLADSMKTYAVMAVLNYHRRMHAYHRDQREKTWDQDTFPEIAARTGIYGFGYLGQEIGKALQQLGFPVFGYSRKQKDVPGITTYGKDQEQAFLDQVNVLVAVLPMTRDTDGLFNLEFFHRLPNPTYFINIGRGAQQNEADILTAIEEGYLTGAMLDVFSREPLPEDSPLWAHPQVVITPHIAGITNPSAAIPQIFENYRATEEGKPLKHIVNKEKGY